MSKNVMSVIAVLIILVAGVWFYQNSNPAEDSSQVMEENESDKVAMLVAEKYEKNISEISLTVDQETDRHMRGMVTFQPGGPGNSGIFLATKVGSEWVLLYDGNGSYECSVVAPYNFPAEMVADCVGN